MKFSYYELCNLTGGYINADEMNTYMMQAYCKTADVNTTQESLFETMRLTLLPTQQGYAPQVAVKFDQPGRAI